MKKINYTSIIVLILLGMTKSYSSEIDEYIEIKKNKQFFEIESQETFDFPLQTHKSAPLESKKITPIHSPAYQAISNIPAQEVKHCWYIEQLQKSTELMMQKVYKNNFIDAHNDLKVIIHDLIFHKYDAGDINNIRFRKATPQEEAIFFETILKIRIASKGLKTDLKDFYVNDEEIKNFNQTSRWKQYTLQSEKLLKAPFYRGHMSAILTFDEIAKNFLEGNENFQNILHDDRESLNDIISPELFKTLYNTYNQKKYSYMMPYITEWSKNSFVKQFIHGNCMQFFEDKEIKEYLEQLKEIFKSDDSLDDLQDDIRDLVKSGMPAEKVELVLKKLLITKPKKNKVLYVPISCSIKENSEHYVNNDDKKYQLLETNFTLEKK